MYDIVTSVDEVGNDGATIPEGPGQVATAIKLATELMKGAELKLGTYYQ